VPPPPEEKAYSLEDFAALLAYLDAEGHESVVIGGCAVGAYARLQGVTMLSADLDLYTAGDRLEELLASASRTGARLLKRPQPRAVPVAVLEWDGKEVNVLTESTGLPPAREAMRTARVFTLREPQGLEILLADPFDLLCNKLALDRPKDQPHIEILHCFVEEEVVAAFESESTARERLAPARRWLEATGSPTLSSKLAARLVPLARTAPELRFLAHRVPDQAQAQEVLTRARATPEITEEIASIIARRGFPR
jgi:hypothetical protein